MSLYAYPRARHLVSVLGQDILLVGLLIAIVAMRLGGRLSFPLAVAIAIVLAWGILTLHFPSRVEMTESGVTFFGYGRSHRFAWGDVERVRVRRFLVRDRVLVRIAPSMPWRGRYWILDGIDGFDGLIAELESRAKKG